jgi:hypothetical protein
VHRHHLCQKSGVPVSRCGVSLSLSRNRWLYKHRLTATRIGPAAGLGTGDYGIESGMYQLPLYFFHKTLHYMRLSNPYTSKVLRADARNQPGNRTAMVTR